MSKESFKRKIAFLDIRKKIQEEDSIYELLSGFDEVIPLTPYSSFLLDKYSINSVSFSSIEGGDSHHSRVLRKYKEFESSDDFTELGSSTYIFFELAKYISFDCYLDIIEEKTKKSCSFYLSDSSNKKLFSVDTMLSEYVKFDNVLFLERDDSFYRRSLLKFTIKRPVESIRKIVKFFLKDNLYTHDNKFHIKKYKRKYKNLDRFFSTEVNFSLFPNKLIKHKDLLAAFVQTNSTLKIEKGDGSFRPFILLNGKDMFLRFEHYKKVKLPIIMMQHGSYVNEGYFLKYNEVYPADINLVFNEYTKKLFIDHGARNVYNVGTLFFDKKITQRTRSFDFVYITHCSQYGYPGLPVLSEISELSATGECIYQRHKQVIEYFGENFSHLTLCVKVKPGIFLGGLMYVPLEEIASKFSNVTIDYVTDLFYLIEKSKYVLSDYFSSEFSNRHVLRNRSIILFDDIIKLDNAEVVCEMKSVFIVVSSIDELGQVLLNMDSYTEQNKISKTDLLIDKYSSDGRDTHNTVNEILDKFLH